MQQETFSNKEHSLQIQESVNGKDVYIVQTGRGGPQVMILAVNLYYDDCVKGDSDLMEVLTMIHTAKINSAASVTVVLPNYPFSRSDKVMITQLLSLLTLNRKLHSVHDTWSIRWTSPGAPSWRGWWLTS